MTAALGLANTLARWVRPARCGPIGVAVGTDRVELLQVQQGAGRPRVRAAGALDLEVGGEASPELSGTLRRALAGRGFRGHRAVAAMPAGRVKLMVLNYRVEGGRDEAEVILAQVGERVDRPLDECIVDYLPIRAGESQPEKSALVAVAERAAVIGFLEELRRAGLQVEALEIEPVAVRRLVRRLTRGDARENSLVLHAGARRSDLTVLWGRRLILYRELDFSEAGAIETLSSTLDMLPESAAALVRQYGVSPPADAPRDLVGPAPQEISQTVRDILKADFQRLAESLRSALVYTASRTRGGALDSVLVTGALAAWPGVADLLEERLSVPVAVLEVGTAFDGHPGDAPPSAVVAGLALRGLVHDA